jgi:Flp pilus assembly pilin Flp
MAKSKTVLGFLRQFAKAEEGLVTVEWVALAGAVVIGGITVVWIVMNNLQTPANNIGSNITSCETSAAQNSGETTGCQ